MFLSVIATVGFFSVAEFWWETPCVCLTLSYCSNKRDFKRVQTLGSPNNQFLQLPIFMVFYTLVVFKKNGLKICKKIA